MVARDDGLTLDLRSYLTEIGRTYDRRDTMASPAQRLLRSASQRLSTLVPAGYVVEGSGGRGNAALIPWIGIFDPDETTTAQRGTYLCYLFAEDMSSVVLTLNQGITEVVREYGQREARDRLQKQASAIRDQLTTEATTRYQKSIDLKSKGYLPRNYELGNILAKTYLLDDLPNDHELCDDLATFVRLYQAALSARDELRLTRLEAIVTPTTREPRKQYVAEFKPKNDSDYIQYFEQRIMRKSRKHETVLSQFATFAKSLGYRCANNVHPRDMLLLNHRGDKWIVEVKIVYNGNGVQATRDALSQLITYRHFLHKEDTAVRLLAVFNEEIGESCAQLLSELGVVAIWRTSLGWAGALRQLEPQPVWS